MRHNIIAILVFIGFITGVFTLGYVVSRDSIPMHRGSVPSINTSGSQSVTRQGVDGDLNLSRVTTAPIGKAGSGYGGQSVSPILSSGDTGSGAVLNTGSSQSLRSVGGGAGSAGAGGTPNATAGGTAKSAVPGSSTGNFSFIAMHKNDRTPVLATAPESEQTIATADEQYTLKAADQEGSLPDDPFLNPVGDVPFWLMMIMVCAYTAFSTLRKFRKS